MKHLYINMKQGTYAIFIDGMQYKSGICEGWERMHPSSGCGVRVHTPKGCIEVPSSTFIIEIEEN